MEDPTKWREPSVEELKALLKKLEVALEWNRRMQMYSIKDLRVRVGSDVGSL